MNLAPEEERSSFSFYRILLKRAGIGCYEIIHFIYGLIMKELIGNRTKISVSEGFSGKTISLTGSSIRLIETGSF
jgi:hypothetical protein